MINRMMTKKNVRGRLSNHLPNPVDVHVGNRMRLRRTILQYSQQYLARKIGLTFQQVQKYEKGLNRIGASRLWDISRVLGVPMNYFFEDMDEETAASSPMMLESPGNWRYIEDIGKDVDPMDKIETLNLVKAYYKVHNPKIRKDVYDLLLHLSTSNSTFPNEEEITKK